jgi:heme-degrading monooxygenase HmoA
VVVREWRGWTRAADADAYQRYIEETGVAELRATPGNLGVQMWRRDEGERSEFVVVSMWDSRDSIRAFAGDDIDAAHYYPEDEQFLLELDPRCKHYDVVASLA